MKSSPSSPSKASYSRPQRASDDPHPPTPAVLSHEYDAAFAVTADYQASLPDLMSPGHNDAAHIPAPIQQVGIAGFRLPLRYAAADDGDRSALALETRVSGTVSLTSHQRAINMSRIIRTFYEFEAEVFSMDTLPRVLARFIETVGSPSARLRLDFAFPMLQRSLRSGLAGYQYYDCAFEAQLTRGADGHEDTLRRWMRLDFVYSSACPCSSELAEHARQSRGVFAVPHSQRSRARVWVEAATGASLGVEDLQAACLRALQTETQVMVRRPDEQAFAELNGAHVKFVEDAARLLHREFSSDARVRDFQIICSHLESLHSHDAVAVICKGVAGGFRGDFTGFDELVC